MDKYAHECAKLEIGGCVTASASINYFKPISPSNDNIIQLDGWYKVGNKYQCYTSYTRLTELEPYATASFLFIKTK